MTSTSIDPLHSKLIDLVVNKKRNILLHGPAGTGKSYLIINVLKQELQKRNKIMDITSTTGVSALSIGGTTIHRWSGIKLGKESVYTITERIKEKNKDCLERWKKCHILVIDEISMLGMKTFLLLDKVGRNICGVDLPFGGKQLILSGDFLQLPPVGDSFSFSCELWEELNFRVFRMVSPKRYPDVDHFNMLMRIRVANHTKEDVKKLYDRCDAYINYIRKGGDNAEKIKPTRIHSLKKDVEHNNLEELSKLEGETIIYNAIDKFATKNKDGDGKASKNKISNKDIMDYTEFLNTVVDKQVYLKPGAQVMLTYNLDMDLGLVNGSRGVILYCELDTVTVLFKNGITTKINYHIYEFEDGKVKMVRRQLPLILAWSVSVHKCQGATLDYAIIDLGPSIFAPGMAYVALSRVRTLDGLLLSNFVPKKIVADPDALELENDIIRMENEEDNEYRTEDIKQTYKKETIILLRGSMCGEKVSIEKIPKVDKQLIGYLKKDCPEIYEIMTPDMWDKLKDFVIPGDIDEEDLYDKLLDMLGLESDNIQETGVERIEEVDVNKIISPPGGPSSVSFEGLPPVEDLSSEED